MVDLDSDERSASVGKPADEHASARKLDEVDNNIEFRECGRALMVDRGDVFGESFFRSGVFEGAFGMVDIPERHFG